MIRYNYFYKITNKINGKFYYGVHGTYNINDNYMGSGTTLRDAKKKYGKENFSKEIILFFKSFEECCNYEALIVNDHMIKDPMCYNNKTGGGSRGILSEASKKKISDALLGNIPAFKGCKHTEETRELISSKRKGKIPWNKGVKITEDQRIKCRNATKFQYENKLGRWKPKL